MKVESNNEGKKTVREMEVRKWLIELKASDHIREIALLFTIFTLSLIGIFIIVTKDRNEKITKAYSNYTKAEGVEYVNGQIAKFAEMGASSGATRTRLPTSSVGSVGSVVPVSEPTYVAEKSNSETPLHQNQPVNQIKPESVNQIKPESVNQIKPESVTVRFEGPFLSPTSSPQILLPFVFKSIPQSSTDKHTPIIDTSSGTLSSTDDKHTPTIDTSSGTLSSTDDKHTPTIDTSSGTLEGFSGQFNGTKLDVFLGVPYAQPPIGNLRFKNPKKVRRSETVLDCSSFKPHCLQKFDPIEVSLRTPTVNVMSEDCLYLNIWSPRRLEKSGFSSSTRQEEELKPIMIWFFGGGFQVGSSNLDEFDGRVLAALGKVIVVTVNYRNGPLGYLDLGTMDAPGNQGLEDMVTAIEWIRENSLPLNGDTGSITVFGQSSGSMAISLLMSNNKIASMFSRVILQSGSPLVPGNMFKNSFTTSIRFAKNLRCYPRSDMAQVSLCLRSLSISQLYNFFHSTSFKKLTFSPKSGDLLLPFLPDEILINKIHDVQNEIFYNSTSHVMIGVTSHESSIMLALEFPQKFTLKEIKIKFNSIQDIHDFIERDVAKKYGMSEEEAFLISNTFFPSTLNLSPDELMKYFLKVTSDLMFVCPSKLFAEKIESLTKAKVFFYEFAQRWKKSPLGEWMGVTHGDDYPYVFGLPLRYPERYTSEDIQVSNFIISSWTNFAKSGTPGPQNDFPPWPNFLTSTGKYLRITSLNSSLPIINNSISKYICEKFVQQYKEL